MDTGYILHLTAVWPFGVVDVLRGGRSVAIRASTYFITFLLD
jgi:hypothetical protein